MSQIQVLNVEQALLVQKPNQSQPSLRKSKELTLDEKEKALVKRGWTHEYAGYDRPGDTSQTSTGADGSD